MTVKGVRADRQQRRTAALMLRTSRRMRVPYRVRVAMIAAATQESGIRPLSHGHGSSVGPLQLISLHGDVRERRDPEFSAGWFLRGAMRIYRVGDRIAVLAYRVQRPADRSGYILMLTRYQPEAMRTVTMDALWCR